MDPASKLKCKVVVANHIEFLSKTGIQQMVQQKTFGDYSEMVVTIEYCKAMANAFMEVSAKTALEAVAGSVAGPKACSAVSPLQIPSVIQVNPPEQPLAETPAQIPQAQPSACPPLAQPPLAQPSAQPLEQPSAQPSTQPSACPPLAQPSAQPLEQPSAQPSAQPLEQPSAQPSTQPPSAQPPSAQPLADTPAQLPPTQPSAHLDPQAESANSTQVVQLPASNDARAAVSADILAQQSLENSVVPTPVKADESQKTSQTNSKKRKQSTSQTNSKKRKPPEPLKNTVPTGSKEQRRKPTKTWVKESATFVASEPVTKKNNFPDLKKAVLKLNGDIVPPPPTLREFNFKKYGKRPPGRGPDGCEWTPGIGWVDDFTGHHADDLKAEI